MVKENTFKYSLKYLIKYICVSQMYTPETCLQSAQSFSIFLVSQNADILRALEVEGRVFEKETYTCDLLRFFSLDPFACFWSIRATPPLENQKLKIAECGMIELQGPCPELSDDKCQQ